MLDVIPCVISILKIRKKDEQKLIETSFSIMQRSRNDKGPLRACIVGGGSSGILAARQMLDEGFQPVIYELSSSLGGLWAYRGDSEEGLPSVMRSTVINSSKELGAFRHVL